MNLQLPKCKVGSREGLTQPGMLSSTARCWPCDRHTRPGEREEGLLAQEQPQQEGMLAPTGTVPAGVQGKKAEGEHSASGPHDYTLSSSRRGL